MMYLLNWRLWLVAGILAAIGGAWFMGDRHGKFVIRAERTAEKLAASEKSRLDERAKSIANEGVDRAFQAEKQKRLIAERVAADSVRDYAAASARADSAATGRTDDPRPAIASECARSLAALDAHAGRLAIQVRGLQDYAERVCVVP